MPGLELLLQPSKGAEAEADLEVLRQPLAMAETAEVVRQVHVPRQRTRRLLQMRECHFACSQTASRAVVRDV